MQFFKIQRNKVDKRRPNSNKKEKAEGRRSKASTDEEEFVRCDLLQRGVAADSAFLQDTKIEFLDTIKTVHCKTCID